MQLGTWLHKETHGSPFFVTELLQMLIEQEIMVGEVGEDGSLRADRNLRPDLEATLSCIRGVERVPLPPNVRDVILARLNRLSDKAQTVLLAGAVIGRECSLKLEATSWKACAASNA